MANFKRKSNSRKHWKKNGPKHYVARGVLLGNPKDGVRFNVRQALKRSIWDGWE